MGWSTCPFHVFFSPMTLGSGPFALSRACLPSFSEILYECSQLYFSDSKLIYVFSFPFFSWFFPLKRGFVALVVKGRIEAFQFSLKERNPSFTIRPPSAVKEQSFILDNRRPPTDPWYSWIPVGHAIPAFSPIYLNPGKAFRCFPFQVPYY